MGPIDYNLQIADPFKAAATGYQLGAGIRDDFQQQAALQQQAQEAQAAKVRQSEVLNSLITNKNAGATDYANAALLLPGMKDQLKQAWETKSTEQQQNALRDMSQVWNAITVGKPDLAVQQLRQRASAMEASGANPREIQAAKLQADLIEAHPEFARAQIGMSLASLPGGDKVLTAASTAGTEQRAQDQAPSALLKAKADASKAVTDANYAAPKAEADIRSTNAQTQNLADRLGLDRDKLVSETQAKVAEMRQKAGELPEPVRKGVDEATTNSIAAQQSATKMLDLAGQLEALGGTGWGAAGSANEFIRKNLGMQNGLSQLRGEYNRIVTPAAMAAYKQVASGSTSDKDIDVAMTGVPKDTADTNLMASFLRGTAKLQQYNAVIENAKSEWLAANKYLGKATQDMEIDGVKVPKGNSFKQFTEEFVAKKVGQMQGQSVLDGLAKKYGTTGATGSY